MPEDFKELEITCPICQMVKSIKVPHRIFSQKKFGTIKIQIPAGAVCREHQFIVFVDAKGIIRGYEKIDIFMGPTPQVKEERAEKKFTIRSLLDEFGTYGFLSLIHAKLFNYPSYIMRDNISDEDANKLNAFFEQFLPASIQDTAPLTVLKDIQHAKIESKEKSAPIDFKPNILATSWNYSSVKFEEELISQALKDIQYDKIKLKEKNALLIDLHNIILQTPWNYSSLKFEEELVKKALNIMNEDEQIIVLQQGIKKFIKEVEYVKKVLEDVEEIYMNDLIEQMTKALHISKINKYHFDLIKEYIQNRISSSLVKKIKNRVHEFLGLL
ncbi:MAG: hypothetical protein ACTSU4_11305 [Promethearchaeota archaeon]